MATKQSNSRKNGSGTIQSKPHQENTSLKSGFAVAVDPTNPQAMREFLERELKRLNLNIQVLDMPEKPLAVLGTGSTGQVTVQMDSALGRTVAVKSLHEHLRNQPDQIERMIREAQAAAQLEHPNIVPIYQLTASPQKGICITMKRLRGDSLRHIINELAQENPAYTWYFTPARRLGIFLKICSGVAYAHSKGVLHRDLKPENIRVGNYGEVTIIDWGLVRSLGHQNLRRAKPNLPETEPDKTSKKPKEQPTERIKTNEKKQKSVLQSLPDATLDEEDVQTLSTSNPTMTGEILGTPRYMSPEQTNSQQELDIRSDIYALGVILYELFTCYNPFFNLEDNMEIIQAVQTGTYPHPRQFDMRQKMPVSLEAICLKAMALNPDNRYQTVSSLIQDIYAYQEGRPILARPPGFILRVGQYMRRHQTLVSIVFVLLFFLVLQFFILKLFNVL